MVERIPMTRAGFEKIKNDLQHLKSVERPKNINDLEVARAHGDLSENAEYSAAKEKQSMIAAQITDLENKVALAEVINPAEVTTPDKIVFGATVKLYDLETEESLQYQIVGDVETDIKNQRVGISSPIAKALLGKKAGDEVKFKTPKGTRELEVVAIEYF